MDELLDITLTVEQREKLEAAMLSAFVNLFELDRMLRLKMGIKINEELNTAQGLKFIMTNLIDIAISGGWLKRLLLTTREYKPGNSQMNSFINKLNISKPEKIDTATIDFEKDKVNNFDLLEKVVNKRAPLIPFKRFTDGLQRIGAQIARVEIPAGTEAGTGWLVGPNLILTAYHVVEPVKTNQNGLNFNDLNFRFDYSDATCNSRICKVGEGWDIDLSPYSDCDLAPSMNEPESNELDYALIKLLESPGEDLLPNGKKRGWIEVPEHPRAMSNNDIIMILQHPEGRPLELSFGEVLKYNNAANRVQYDSNTQHGSSGSPCFDIELQPFALHHASGPAKSLNYNQGVPLREIIKLMKKRNIKPFWK